jgi:hypothetical protein
MNDRKSSSKVMSVDVVFKAGLLAQRGSAPCSIVPALASGFLRSEGTF